MPQMGKVISLSYIIMYNLCDFPLGAYYGFSEIPESFHRHCEALSDAIEQADQLFKMRKPKSTET